MPKIAYIEKSFQNSSLQIIQQANDIIDEYQEDGLSLTLRQLYYQFVARGLLPNKQRQYKRLGNIISDARLAGLIDWEAIEDRTRNLQSLSHWKNPGEIIDAATYQFQVDHWKDQEYRVEVWIEKEALAGVIAEICDDFDVPYFACKGFVSQSEMWSASQRLLSYEKRGQTPVVIYLGDHDPSGLDMTRDIFDRMALFGVDIDLNRIALNFDQIEIFNPPPNPAKKEDSRYFVYTTKFGPDSWELDALDPKTLRNLIDDTVSSYRDDEIYRQVIQTEIDYREVLKKFSKTWDQEMGD